MKLQRTTNVPLSVFIFIMSVRDMQILSGCIICASPSSLYFLFARAKRAVFYGNV